MVLLRYESKASYFYYTEKINQSYNMNLVISQKY